MQLRSRRAAGASGPPGAGRSQRPPPPLISTAALSSSAAAQSTPPSFPAPPPPPPAHPAGLRGVLLPADSPLRTSAAAYSALLALAGGAARVKCGETALGRGLVVPRAPLPPVPATLPPIAAAAGPRGAAAGGDAGARAGAFRSPASAPTLAHPPVVTCTEDDDDDDDDDVEEEERRRRQQQCEEDFFELAGLGRSGAAGGGLGSSSSSSSSSSGPLAAAATTTTLDEAFGIEDYGEAGAGSNSSSSNSSNSNSNSSSNRAGSDQQQQRDPRPPPPTTTLRRGEVAVAVPMTSALVVTDEPLEGPSAVGDRQQAQWQIEHGTLPPALADFLQQGGARWDVRMTAWVLWLAAGAAERSSPNSSSSSPSSSCCSPLWAHYLSLMPTPHELCPLLMYGRSDLDEEEEEGGGDNTADSHRAARLIYPSNTPTAWLQLPSLIAEADSQREWSEYMHDAYFAPINGSGGGGKGGGAGGSGGSRVVNSAASSAGAAARQLRALRGGKGLSPSRAASAWAQALVRSRSFSDDVGGEALTLMVPFADLANHAPAGGAATFHVSRDGRAFHLRALRASPSRSELTIAYGERTCNDHLLRDYGFVVPANPYDRLPADLLLLGPSSNSSAATATTTTTLNAASLLEYAGFGGDPNNGEPDSVKPLPGVLAAASAASSSSFSSAATATTTTTADAADALAKRQRLVRRRCVLLSLPTRNTSPHAGAPGAAGSGSGGPASALFAWASSAAAPPPPLPLRKRDAPAERAAAARLLAAVDARLASLPTSAPADEALLLEGRADVDGDGSLGGRGRGGATRPLTPREATAVHARLEHKRLLLEARAVLRGYDAWVSQML